MSATALGPRYPLRREVRERRFLPRHVAASRPSSESKQKVMRYHDGFAAWVNHGEQISGE